MPKLNANELELVLSLVDNASADFKKVNQEALKQLKGIEKQTEDTGKKTEDTNKKSEKSWVRMTVTIASVIQIMRMLGKGLKDIINIGRETDAAFNKAFSRFDASVLNVKKSIAEELTPALTVALNFWSEFLDKKFQGSLMGDFNRELDESNARLAQLVKDKEDLLNGKKTQTFVIPSIGGSSMGARAIEVPMKNTDTKELDILIEREKALQGNIKARIGIQEEANVKENARAAALSEATTQLKNFKKAQEESALLFVTGNETATQYYESVLESQDSVIAKNQVIAEDLRNLAILETQLGDEKMTRARNEIAEQMDLLRFYQQEQRIAQQGIATLMVQVGQTMQTSMSNAMTGIIMGTTKAKDAFKALGTAMVESVVNFIAQKLVASVIEKTLLAGTVAASTTAGAMVAAAWAPAAAMVSLATLGANAAPAMAGMIATSALSTSLAAIGAAGTGDVVGVAKSLGSGTGLTGRAMGGDDIVTKPTMFMAGEGNRPERVTVSPVGGQDFHGGGGINIYIGSATMDSAAGISGTAEMLGRELETSLRRARSF
jgi:hypothetical protein